MPNTIDITPSPRILRTLGEIPFQPWQCIAELVDKRNMYLSRDEQERIRDEFPDGQYPSNIIERPKRLKGWVGIQRYADPNDFGIDFIRNGRKILISNRDLFSWENPMTGTSTLE